MTNGNCIFCKIASGEIPSYSVYEDDSFKAVLDIEPASKGHTLILPKRHAADLFELEDDDAAKALIVAKKVATALKSTLGCDGVNILQNNGEAAGQTVRHYHIHLIPRYFNDNISIVWKHGSIDKSSVDEFLEAVRGQIK